MIPKLDEQAATMDAANAVCEREPIQRAVLDELLHIAGHGTENGFDITDIRNTYVFQVAVNQATNEAASAPMATLTRLVRHVAVTMELAIPHAMELVSMMFANPELGPPMPGFDIDGTVHGVLHELGLIEGWDMYGFGVASMAQSVRADAPGSDQLLSGELSPDILDNHPNMCAVWYAHLVGTDSRVWSVLHQEGYELVYGTSGADEPAADVAELEALTRLVNTYTGQ